MIKRSNGRRQTYVSALIPFCVWDRWKTLQKQRKMERTSGRTQVVFVLPRCSGYRFSSIRVEKCSRIFIMSGNPNDLEKIQPEEFECRIIFMSMFKICTHWWELCFECKKVRIAQFVKRHWFLGPGSEEEKYGSSNHAQEGQWNCTAANMVQRCKETGHLVFKSISSLSRGILKQKKGKTSIHFNGDSMNTELLFQTFQSVNQRSVHGAVTDWCYQFGSTEEEKGWASTSVDNKILTKLKPQEEQLLVSPPTRATGNRMQERVLSFDELAGKIQLTQSCEKKKLISYILMQPGNSTKFDQMGTDGEHLHFVPRTFDFSIPSESPSFGSYSWRHNHWTGFGSSSCENSSRIWNWSCDSIFCKANVHILRCYIKRNRAFCEWNSWSRRRAQVQWWIAHRTSRISKKWTIRRKKRKLEQRGNLC